MNNETIYTSTEEEFRTAEVYEAALEYKALGMSPLPIPPVKGDPVKSPQGLDALDWPTRAANDDYCEEDYADPQCNLGICLGGEDNLSDIDCDVALACRLAKLFLCDMKADETMMFGRDGKPRSHYFYKTDRSLSTERIKDPVTQECLIEYRCITKEGKRAEQTVVPPSVWYKDGRMEDVRFEGDSAPEPAFIEASTLHRTFRMIAATVILATHFPVTSGRHDTFLALGGIFASNGIEERDAVKIVSRAYENSGGYNNDCQNAEGAVRDSYKKFRASPDNKLIGYPKLLQAIPKLVADKVLELLGISRQPEPAKLRRSAKETLAKLRGTPVESFPAQVLTYLIDGLIPAGKLVIITGKPGCGKSTLVQHWCIQMAKAGNEVLYLDKDNPLSGIQERTNRFGGKTVAGFTWWGLWNNDGEDNSDRSMEPPHPSDRFLLDIVKEMKNPVLVFDTFAMFSDCDENDNTAVNEFFKACRYLQVAGATVLVTHHVGKNESSMYRGASSMEGAVDVMLNVKGTRAEGKLTKMEIEPFKSRNGDGTIIVYGMHNGIPFRETTTRTDTLVKLLEINPGVSKAEFEEIAEGRKFKRETVRTFMDAGIDDGTILYIKKKLYVKSVEGEPSKAQGATTLGGAFEDD